MRSLIFTVVIAGVTVISGCSKFGEGSKPIYGVTPGLFLPDTLSVIYCPDGKDSGVLEISEGSVFLSGHEWSSENPYPLGQEMERRRTAYWTFDSSDSNTYRKWLDSHLEEFDKLQNNNYYYLGVKSIGITANINIGNCKSGTDISHLFVISSFGVDYSCVFSYPDCNPAFENPAHLPETLAEFCSVSPLYMNFISLRPLFELNEIETSTIEFTVTMIVDDEFLGERTLMGVSHNE